MICYIRVNLGLFLIKLRSMKTKRDRGITVLDKLNSSYFLEFYISFYRGVFFMKKKKLIWALIILVLLASIYEVVIKTQTVTYMGENKNWLIKINSKLVGLNGSYNIEIRYKRKATIQNADFNIHPQHYASGFPIFNKNGYYYWECKDDCGYFDKESKLLFFIVWRENNNSEEKMNFIELRKISKD